MSKFSVTVLPIAEEDMKGIGDYIAETLCNRSSALNIIGKFYESFERIAAFPESGTKVNLSTLVKHSYRFIVVESYMVFYTVDTQNEKVIVARVLYGASNYISILSKEE